MWFGMTIENALAETIKQGTGKDAKTVHKYTLTQLLDPAFFLPKPAPPVKTAQPAQNGFAALLALSKQAGSGVKLWKAS
jgi:hypothetical protein